MPEALRLKVLIVDDELPARERLSLMYGERALMKSGRFDAEYIVTLRFPLIENPARIAAAARA